jgi:branched-chain amino acid transport system permease protein
LRYLGFTLDTQRAASWLGALAVAAIGCAAFEFVRRRFAREWGRIQGEIEEAMTFKEPDAPIPEGGEAAARAASLGTP